MAATIAATRAFFLGTGRVAGDGCGTAFRDPVPGLQLASHRRVTDRLVVCGEIIAEEMHRPAVFNRAEVAGTVDEERRDLFGNALAFGGLGAPVGVYGGALPGPLRARL